MPMPIRGTPVGDFNRWLFFEIQVYHDKMGQWIIGEVLQVNNTGNPDTDTIVLRWYRPDGSRVPTTFYTKELTGVQPYQKPAPTPQPSPSPQPVPGPQPPWAPQPAPGPQPPIPPSFWWLPWIMPKPKPKPPWSPWAQWEWFYSYYRPRGRRRR